MAWTTITIVERLNLFRGDYVTGDVSENSKTLLKNNIISDTSAEKIAELNVCNACLLYWPEIAETINTIQMFGIKITAGKLKIIKDNGDSTPEFDISSLGDYQINHPNNPNFLIDVDTINATNIVETFIPYMSFILDLGGALILTPVGIGGSFIPAKFEFIGLEFSVYDPNYPTNIQSLGIKNFIINVVNQEAPPIPSDKNHFITKEYLQYVVKNYYNENKEFAKIKDTETYPVNFGSKILYDLFSSDINKIASKELFLRYVDILSGKYSPYLSTPASIPATGGTTTISGYVSNGDIDNIYKAIGFLNINNSILVQTTFFEIRCYASAEEWNAGTPTKVYTYDHISANISTPVIGRIQIIATADSQTSSSNRTCTIKLLNFLNKQVTVTLVQSAAGTILNPPSGYTAYWNGTLTIGQWAYRTETRRGFYLGQGGSISRTSMTISVDPHVIMAVNGGYVQLHMGNDNTYRNKYIWIRIGTFFILSKLNSYADGFNYVTLFINLSNKSQSNEQARLAFYDYLGNNLNKNVVFNFYIYNTQPSV